jgi:DNA-binding beta-propeller fold protein YncE
MYPVDVSSNSVSGQSCTAATSGCYYFILDAGNYRVLALNRVSHAIDFSAGGMQGNAPPPGSPPGASPVQFSDARAIAWDSRTDDVYVADTANNRVVVFSFSPTSGFSYLTQFGSKGTGNGQFTLAYGVAVDAAHRWVYVTDGKGRVEKFSIGTGSPPAITFLDSFGSGTLKQPRQVEVAPNGDVFVSNRPANATQHYFYVYSDTAGASTAPEFGFGGAGSGLGQFSNDPRGIAVTADGTMAFATDSGGDRIEAFMLTQSGGHDTAATPSYAISNPGGTGGTAFVGPRGLTTTADNHLLLADEWGYGLHEFVFTPGTTGYSAVWNQTPRSPAVPGVNAPRGVHLAPNGDIYVMDYWNQRVEYGKYGSAGVNGWTLDSSAAFGARGDPSQPGAINFAWDFAIDPCVSCATAGDVFVANRESHQIQVFSATGTPLFIYGSRGTADDQFTFPQGIAFSPNGSDLFVDDSGNDRIQEFTVGTNTLDYLATFGQKGTGPTSPAGDLNMPSGITVSPDGSTLWVADTLNNRIQSLTLSTGTWNAPIAAPSGTGHQRAFRVPWGVAVAPDGTLWVSDTGNNRVVSMTTAGSLVFSATGASMGVPSVGGSQTIYPFAIAFDSSGHAFLSDIWNNRVLVLTA